MFMTPEEVGNMMSGDHLGWKVRDVVTPMAEESDDLGEWRTSGGGTTHRGLGSYLNSMQRNVESVGGIEQPIHVAHTPDGAWLVDGHHRAIVAQRTGHLLPVVHHETEHPIPGNDIDLEHEIFGWR